MKLLFQRNSHNWTVPPFTPYTGQQMKPESSVTYKKIWHYKYNIVQTMAWHLESL